jgi:hypothetical protein
MTEVGVSFLPCEPFVEEGKNFRDVKLHVLEIEILLAILLHFK